MNKTKRSMGLLLALMMLLGLCACRGEGQKPAATPAARAEPTPLVSEGQWQGKGGCYKMGFVGGGENCYDVRAYGEYFLFQREEGVTDADGNVLKEGFPYNYLPAEDGLWYADQKGFAESGEYDRSCYAVKLSYDGQELARFDIAGGTPSLAVDREGNLLVYDRMDCVLSRYGQDGTLLGEVDLSAANPEEFGAKLFSDGKGEIYLLTEESSLWPVDTETMSLGEERPLPEGTELLEPGTAEKPCLVATGTELMYWNPETGGTENILYWGECYINMNDISSIALDGDGFLCVCSASLARISPAEPGEIKEKTTLLMGAPYPVGSRYVAEFNAESEEYFIQIVDYSDGGSLQPEEAQLRLNTELLSGGGPDLILWPIVDASGKKNVYMDLYPLIDADAELSREDFYALNALEENGALYYAPSGFTINSYCAFTDTVGDKLGLSWDEYFALQEQLPEGGVMASYLGKETFLRNSLDGYLPKAIDWENASCDFYNDDFIRILQAALDGYDPNCPEENPYFWDEVREMMVKGEMILDSAWINTPEAFGEEERAYGRRMSYVGWPTPDGSCGSTFYINQISNVAINLSTQHPEACWEFVKGHLTSSNLYKPVFEQQLKEAMTPQTVDGETQEPKLTAEQAERYRELVESIQVVSGVNETIAEIVLRETEAMFAGDKTPEETAKIIQSKLSIYVAENA